MIPRDELRDKFLAQHAHAQRVRIPTADGELLDAVVMHQPVAELDAPWVWAPKNNTPPNRP